MKYFRHHPLTFWFVVFVLLAGVLAYARTVQPEPVKVSPAPVALSTDRSDAMALIGRLSSIHAVAAPPADGLAQWGLDTASIAQQLAERRDGIGQDNIRDAYLAVAAAAAGLATIDPLDREQVLTGIAALGAAGNRLGLAVNRQDITLTPSATTGGIG